MAVKTIFSDEELAAILPDYGIGSLIRAKPIVAGTVQTNYLLQTTRGRYVFRYYENRSRESVLFENDLLAHLAKCQFPCAPPIMNNQGAGTGEYNHKPYLISAWIEGQSAEKPTAKQWQQLIQKAAELQIITRDFSSTYTRFRMNYDPDLCLKLARDEAQRLNSETAHAKLAWLSQELAQLDLPPSMPKGICHCDFHFSNVLFKGNEFAALLDFDDANYTYETFDLVGLIEYAAWPYPAVRLDLEEACCVVQAYEQYRPLEALERAHLFDVYRLSILFDCVWYFERGAADDFYEKIKVEALNELGRGRFVEAIFC